MACWLGIDVGGVDSHKGAAMGTLCENTGLFVGDSGRNVAIGQGEEVEYG